MILMNSATARVFATARAVWNGPFYIGKLARPVSLGEVALKLLETIWRSVIVLAAAAGSVVAAAAAWEARPLPRKLSEQIVGTAYLGNSVCDAIYPLSVILKNNSKERIGRVNFHVAAYEPGRSTDLVPAGSGDYVSDFIIPANGTMPMCWETPSLSDKRDLAGLRFVLTVTEAEATKVP